MKILVLKLIRLYQFAVSPWLGPHCRFLPTCSEYAHEAIRTDGLLAGAFRSFLRLARCHPLAPWGFDPVRGFSAQDR